MGAVAMICVGFYYFSVNRTIDCVGNAAWKMFILIRLLNDFLQPNGNGIRI